MRIVSSFLFAAMLFAAPAGQYGGTWTSDGGVNSGKVNITLAAGADGKWRSDLSFTYQDQLIKPRTVTTKVEDNQVEFLCESELEGFRLRTSFLGSMEAAKISGKYQTISVDDGSAVDSGTWEVTQKQ